MYLKQNIFSLIHAYNTLKPIRKSIMSVSFKYKWGSYVVGSLVGACTIIYMHGRNTFLQNYSSSISKFIWTYGSGNISLKVGLQSSHSLMFTEIHSHVHYTLYINFVLLRLLFIKHISCCMVCMKQYKNPFLKSVMVMKFGTTAIVLLTTGWFLPFVWWPVGFLV